MNTLFYGDNLDVLRRRVPDDSVDLVYLDPPFKSTPTTAFSSASTGRRQPPSVNAFTDTLGGSRLSGF